MSNLNTNVTIPCKKCQGTGKIHLAAMTVRICDVCHGSGRLIMEEKGSQIIGSRDENQSVKSEKLGFIDSLDLAYRILLGSLRLLKQYPKLLTPLLPILILVLLLEASIFISLTWMGFGLFMLALAVVAYSLMFSFAVSSMMLKQIQEDMQPSLTRSLMTAEMPRLALRVLGLSAVWYFLVLILVAIEIIVGAFLNRISDGLGDAVMRAVFGTIADALRMAGFMMVAIMTFEDIGLSSAFRRMRTVLKNHSIAALGGLFLTKMVTGMIFLIIYSLSFLLNDINLGPLGALVLVAAMSLGWLLTMYLEQLFVAGLYIYSTAPDSPLVSILFGEMLGKELAKPAYGS